MKNKKMFFAAMMFCLFLLATKSSAFEPNFELMMTNVADKMAFAEHRAREREVLSAYASGYEKAMREWVESNHMVYLIGVIIIGSLILIIVFLWKALQLERELTNQLRRPIKLEPVEEVEKKILHLSFARRKR